MAYGLSASAKGDIFPWVFNPPATYWDGLSEILKYFGGGSIEKLKGKTIGYLYFDAGFGREPIPMFQSLAKEFGFTLKLYPVAPASMQNQSAQWLDIRRDKPDFVVMYGWGAMNADRHQGGDQGRIPMDKFVSIWWPGDADAVSAGDGAKGFKELNWHGVGRELSRLAGHQEEGLRRRQEPDAEGRNRPTLLYDRGVYNSVLIAEAIANAQKITGKKVVTGEDVRRGLENIDLDAARFKALGLEGFAAPFKTTCADHNSHSATFIQQWDGAKWVKVTDPSRRKRQGAAAARRGRQGLRREERRLAGAHRALRQQVRRALIRRATRVHLLPQREKVAPPLPLAGEGRGEGSRTAAARRRSSTSSTSRSSTAGGAGAEGRFAVRARRRRSSRCSAPTAPARRRP